MSTKNAILALLEEDKGEYISGTAMAERLQLSRNAVWQAIKDLQKEGYRITGVTNKGYCLSRESDILSKQGILPFLLNKENDIFVYPSLSSTNKTAKELAAEGAKHGTVVLAEGQSAGRGRYGRSFYSPPTCGLYMSIILRPQQFALSTATLVTAMVAVGVCQAIEETCLQQPQIKWVNDIFLEGKKVCGILTEVVADIESGSIQWLVVGIGINFSTRREDFPEELRSFCTSLFPMGKASLSRNQLAAAIINNTLAIWSKYDKQVILADYKSRLLTLGQRVLVMENGLTYEALAVAIDDNAYLLVQKDDGSRHTLSAGAIRSLG